MSVFEKIKINMNSISKNALIFITLMLLFTNSQAQQLKPNNAQVYSIVEYEVTGWKIPRGFVSMLIDYDDIENKMLIDIKNGHGDIWKSWMKEGLENDESLYWWLYSRWLWENNKKKDAYNASVMALVLSRLDVSTCPTERNRNLIDSFLSKNADIINQKLSDEDLRYSVLNSITRAESRIKNNTSMQMMCSIYTVQRAVQRDMRNVNIFPSGGNKDIRQRRLVRTQTVEIEKIKDEFYFDRAFRDANINTIWEVSK